MQISEYRWTNNPFFNFGVVGLLGWPRSNIVRGRPFIVSEDLKTIPILCYNNPKQAKSCEIVTVELGGDQIPHDPHDDRFDLGADNPSDVHDQPGSFFSNLFSWE